MLAVDDDPQALRHIRDALVRADYRPIMTADPEEAVRLVEEERPTWSCSTGCCREPTGWS